MICEITLDGRRAGQYPARTEDTGAKRRREQAMIRNPEQPPDAEEEALEATIRRLAERRDAAREGSAEYRMVIRQLKGLRNSQLAEQIMEEYGYWGGD